MRRDTFVAFVFGVAAGLTGCARLWSPKPTVFVPVVDQEFRARQPAEAPPAKRPEPKTGLPEVQIVARVIRCPASRLAELGVDPDTGCDVVVRDGRFGPYVTDGSVNASLRREDAVETITLERACDLLRMRRAKLEEQGKEVKPCPKSGSAE